MLCLKMPFKKTFITEEPAVELLAQILFGTELPGTSGFMQ